jgi:hypothetical protein
MRTGFLASALAALATPALGAPAGTLLFAKGDLQIINAAGISRIGKAGDVLQPGERVVTPDGAVCQIRLWDGSLIGVRPDTELKVELPDQASARAKSVIQVVKGELRVINLDLRDGRARVPITLQSPTGVVDLTNADAESRVVSPETAKKAGVKDPGLYTRVQIGKGTIRTGAVEIPIAIRTVAFTPTIDVAPTTVSSSGTSLFTSTSLTTTKLATTTLTTATLDPKLTTSLSTTTLDPKLTTSLSTSTLEPKLTTSTLSTATLSPTTSTLTSPTLTTSLTSPTLTTSLSSPTLATTFTSPTLATTSYTAPTTTTLTSSTLSSPTLSTTYIAPTTYTAPTTTTTMISSTTLTSPTLTKTTTTSGTTTTFTSKTGTTLTLR